jgi:hypothetical protein
MLHAHIKKVVLGSKNYAWPQDCCIWADLKDRVFRQALRPGVWNTAMSVGPYRANVYQLGANIFSSGRDILGAPPLYVLKSLLRSMHHSNERYNDIGIFEGRNE